MRPQGDEADCFYIVESGQVKIMIRSKVSSERRRAKRRSPKVRPLTSFADEGVRTEQRRGRGGPLLSGTVLRGAGAGHQQASRGLGLRHGGDQMSRYRRRGGPAPPPEAAFHVFRLFQ